MSNTRKVMATTVGLAIPARIGSLIDRAVEGGEFDSRSALIRAALREFFKNRGQSLGKSDDAE